MRDDSTDVCSRVSRTLFRWDNQKSEGGVVVNKEDPPRKIKLRGITTYVIIPSAASSLRRLCSEEAGRVALVRYLRDDEASVDCIQHKDIDERISPDGRRIFQKAPIRTKDAYLPAEASSG